MKFVNASGRWLGVIGAVAALLSLGPATALSYASSFADLLGMPDNMDNKILLGFGLDGSLCVINAAILSAASLGLLSLNPAGEPIRPATT